MPLQMSYRLLSVCMCGLLLCTTIAGRAQLPQQVVDSIVHSYDKQGGFNGIIITAYAPDKIATYTYGYKNVAERKGKIKNNTRFDLASVTKQFTGVAITQLMNKGLLRAEDTIGKYLPQLKPALRKVTIQQLANHTNGIHDYYSLTKDHDKLTKQIVMELLSPLDTTVFKPGSRWGYTNSGYVLLSQIVERVTGQSFETYLKQNVLLPFGMKDACFVPCKKGLKGHNAKREQAPGNTFFAGDAGMYASASDFINYYKTVSNYDSVLQYFTQAHNMADSSNTPGWTYGYGWYFSKDSLDIFRAHSGRSPGVSTYVRYYYYHPVFVCVLSNKSDDFIKPLREELCHATVAGYKAEKRFVPVPQLNYSIEEGKRYYTNSDTSQEVFISYPIIKGRWKKDVAQKLNEYLYNEYVPADSITNTYLGNDLPEEEVQTGEEDTANSPDNDWYGRDEVYFNSKFANNDYLCLAQGWVGDYRGAAHGSWSSKYYHFDMRKGRQLKLTDMFKDGLYDAIKPLVLNEWGTSTPQTFRDTLDMRHVDFDFIINGNCKEDCLQLYFAPYSDIGAYMGLGYVDMEIPVPAEIYLPHMKRKWKKRLYK